MASVRRVRDDERRPLARANENRLRSVQHALFDDATALDARNPHVSRSFDRERTHHRRDAPDISGRTRPFTQLGRHFILRKSASIRSDRATAEKFPCAEKFSLTDDTLGFVGDNPYAAPIDSSKKPVVASTGQSSGLTALSIVMMAFGGLGLFSAPITLMSREIGRKTGSGHIQDLMWEGAPGTWMRMSIFVGTVFAVWLLVSGFGVFKRKPWARQSSMLYGISAIVFGVVGQIVSFLVVFPALSAAAEVGGRVERAGATGGMIGGIVGGLFGMILPIVILVVMTRPSIKAELGAPDLSSS